MSLLPEGARQRRRGQSDADSPQDSSTDETDFNSEVHESLIESVRVGAPNWDWHGVDSPPLHSYAEKAIGREIAVDERYMKKNGGAKSEKTRQRILDSAAHVLGKRGYASAHLSEIAELAHVKISTLYYHFESREELVEEVIVAGSMRVRTHVENAVKQLPPKTAPIELVCAAVEAHLRFILEISDYTTAAIRNMGQLPESIQQKALKEQRIYIRFWQQLIEAAAVRGHYPEKEIRVLRLLIIGALNWTVEWWSPKDMPLEVVVSAAVNMTRRALAGPER